MGVLDPPLEAPEPGRGIPAGEGERDRFCPGCPPICEPRRPATDGFVMAAICAGPMEPGRDGVAVRVVCIEAGADGRADDPAADVGVPVLEGPPDGGCGVEEGDILVAPFMNVSIAVSYMAQTRHQEASRFCPRRNIHGMFLKTQRPPSASQGNRPSSAQYLLSYLDFA